MTVYFSNRKWKKLSTLSVLIDRPGSNLITETLSSLWCRNLISCLSQLSPIINTLSSSSRPTFYNFGSVTCSNCVTFHCDQKASTEARDQRLSAKPVCIFKNPQLAMRNRIKTGPVQRCRSDLKSWLVLVVVSCARRNAILKLINYSSLMTQ